MISELKFSAALDNLFPILSQNLLFVSAAHNLIDQPLADLNDTVVPG